MQVAPWALVWALGKLHHAVAPLVPYSAHESNLAAVARFLEVHVTILTHLPLCLLVFVLQVLHLFTLWGQVRQFYNRALHLLLVDFDVDSEITFQDFHLSSRHVDT